MSVIFDDLYGRKKIISKNCNCYCDSCGKETTLLQSDGTVINYVGLKINFTMKIENDEQEKFWLKQLGDYKKPEYNLCYECWLKNMRVKP